MLVFVDESGDPGMKLDKGSSNFFVLTLVVFDDNENAQFSDDAINDIRNQLRLNPYSEFKFNKLRDTSRRHFLQSVAQHSFAYYSIVINKAKLTGKGFAYKGSFYKYACSLAFNNAKGYLDEAVVVIDGSGVARISSTVTNLY